MKRRYKLTEVIDRMSVSGECLLCDITFASVLISLIRPITDTDGEPVDTTLYNFVTDLLTVPTGGTRPAGFYYDRAYANKYGDLWTVHEYESDLDAKDAVIERSASIIAQHLDDLTRLYYALNLPYNPLYNKDATETHTGDITDEHRGDDDTGVKGDVQDAETNTSSGERDGQLLQDATVTEDTSRVPYNNSDHYDTDRVETKTPVMGTDTTSKNSVDYHTKTEYNSDLTKIFNTTDRAFGNLGITKSTDLLESEYTMRMKHNFWAYLYDLCLKDQFMRGVSLCEY